MKRSREEESEIPPTPSLEYGLYTTHQTIEIMIHSEMRGYIYSNVPDFLPRFLPQDEPLVATIDTAIRAKGGLITEDGKWNDLQPKPPVENVLYGPFVTILNYIVDRCPPNVPLDWRTESTKAPASDFDFRWKPDAVCVSKDDNEIEWSKIHIPIEFKKRNSITPALPQLIAYCRGTLREQPNRRFVYGLTVSGPYVQVWLFDRSGALGSEPIDIHKNPIDLIRIIVGFSKMSLTELGYDPTLELVARADSPYQTRWKVDMKIDKNHDPEPFLLFEAISLSRAEVICGRSSRIWKAWRMSEIDLPEKKREIFIFKDEWRDDRRLLEGELYEKAQVEHGLARVCDYGVVKIEDEDDTTERLIRKDYIPEGYPIRLPNPMGSSKSSLGIRKAPDPSPQYDTHVIPKLHYDEFPLEEGEKPHYRGRTHSRLLLRSFGWPIKHFLTLEELLRALYGAIKGHRDAFANHVLHRDISYGNILINAKRSEDCPDLGFLIDFNYGSVTEGYEALVDDMRSPGTVAFMSGEILAQRFISPAAVGRALRNNGVKHEEVHDLEGFFWVLCYLCMTREGPNSRRPELRETTAPATKQLHAAVSAFFEQEDREKIGTQKIEALRFSEGFEDEVLKYFHPLFETLKPLALGLHDVLSKAYSTRDFTGLHDKFLGLVDAAAVGSKTFVYDGHTLALMDAERKRRAEELDGGSGGGAGWDHSPSIQRNTQKSNMPPMPTTPPNASFPDGPTGRAPLLVEQESPTSYVVQARGRDAKRFKPE